MNIYFFTLQSNVTHVANITILAALQKMGAEIHSNLEDLSTTDEFPKNIDALVVLGGPIEQSIDSDLSYIIALGIAYQKPILYFNPSRVLLPDDIYKISQKNDIKKMFTIASFSPQKVTSIVDDFINRYFGKTEAFSIKFTLRLNEELNRYLKWKSKKAKKKKADFVRQLIEELMKGDEEYNKI